MFELIFHLESKQCMYVIKIWLETLFNTFSVDWIETDVSSICWTTHIYLNKRFFLSFWRSRLEVMSIYLYDCLMLFLHQIYNGYNVTERIFSKVSTYSYKTQF